VTHACWQHVEGTARSICGSRRCTSPAVERLKVNEMNALKSTSRVEIGQSLTLSRVTHFVYDCTVMDKISGHTEGKF